MKDNYMFEIPKDSTGVVLKRNILYTVVGVNDG